MKGGLSKRYLSLKYGMTKSPRSRISRDASAKRGSSRSTSGMIQVPATCRSSAPKKTKAKLRIAGGKAETQRYPRVKDKREFRRIQLWQWLLFFAGASVLIVATFYLDASVQAWMTRHQQPAARSFMEGVS